MLDVFYHIFTKNKVVFGKNASRNKKERFILRPITLSIGTARHKDSTEYSVSNDMTFAEWKKKQDEKYGEGTVDTVRKMHYNKIADNKYKQVLGKDAPKKLTISGILSILSLRSMLKLMKVI